MNRLIIESNREFTKKKINEEIDKLYNEIRKISLENEDLKKCNSIIETDKTRFAIAYAKKIGVILTQRQYDKRFKEKDLLDEIFVDKHGVNATDSVIGGKE